MSKHPLASALKKCGEPAHIAAFRTKIINTSEAVVVRKAVVNDVTTAEYEILTRCSDSPAGGKVFAYISLSSFV